MTDEFKNRMISSAKPYLQSIGYSIDIGVTILNGEYVVYAYNDNNHSKQRAIKCGTTLIGGLK